MTKHQFFTFWYSWSPIIFGALVALNCGLVVLCSVSTSVLPVLLLVAVWLILSVLLTVETVIVYETENAIRRCFRVRGIRVMEVKNKNKRK
jgi:hypothetical protein